VTTPAPARKPVTTSAKAAKKTAKGHTLATPAARSPSERSAPKAVAEAQVNPPIRQSTPTKASPVVTIVASPSCEREIGAASSESRWPASSGTAIERTTRRMAKNATAIGRIKLKASAER
jgi:hypothetical protein